MAVTASTRYVSMSGTEIAEMANTMIARMPPTSVPTIKRPSPWGVNRRVGTNSLSGGRPLACP
jgi:hypothetical protein